MNKIAFIAISISLASISCQKDTDFESIESQTPIKVVNYYNPNAREESSSILVFNNQQTYINTLNQLQQDVENWDDTFVARWGYLDDDTLNDKEEELSFDDQKPLTDFENQYGFHSLRKEFLNKEEEWLNNDILDDSNDPNNDYIWDIEEMSLLGLNGEIQIGISIFKFEKNRTIEIKDGDLNKLILIIQGDTNVFLDKNVIVTENSTPSGTCIDNSDHDGNYYYDGKYRIWGQWKLNNYHPFIRPYFKSKTKSYKKRNGRWKKYRTTVESRIKGNLSFELASQACGAELHYKDVYRQKRRKSLSVYLKSPDKIFLGSYFENDLKSIHKQKFTVERWFGSN